MIRSGMLCAGYRLRLDEDKEKCAVLGYGDSGGPLTCQSTYYENR